MTTRARRGEKLSKPAARAALAGYAPLLVELKERVRTAQVRAAAAVNAGLVGLYWQIGRAIAEQQAREGWGAGVIPRLAADLREEFPEMQGFSERNLKYMVRFAAEYGAPPIVQRIVAQLNAGEKASGSSIVQQPAAQSELRCFVVIDLKVEAFKPEFAGKMNFYLSAVDDRLRHRDDQPTIGLLLCQENNRVTVEYALRDVKKPIGVAEWKTRLVDSLPKNLRGALPSIEQLEHELAKG